MAGDIGGLTRRTGTCVSEGQHKDATMVQSEHHEGVSAQKIPPEAERFVKEVSSAPVWSSGVPFYPPSTKYWRIGGKWYDFATFLNKHPGGAEVLLLSRDRFEDCTFVFEAHHHNYQKVRAIIKKYEVSEEEVRSHGLRERPKLTEKADTSRPAHHDSVLDTKPEVKLLDDNAFYSVLRRRVTTYLRDIGFPQGGPTLQCKTLFWANFSAWLASYVGMWYTGSFMFVPTTGLCAAWLGAFGHNWQHQPKYKLWGYFSLDAIGFSSDGWFREHNLQHHMYTNTPWDNHFKGTDPFIVTDPTIERSWFQKYISPYANPIFLCFGLYANYAAHTVELLKGNEKFALPKLVLPFQISMMIYRWGWIRGLGLILATNSVLSIYYFSIALMNHNSEHCVDVASRNKSRDWAVAQLHSSADWGVQCNFLTASRYLWLNYHTVHHLFPLIDFSHHPAIQGILMKTCEEFGVYYEAGKFWQIYKEMVHTFASPRALMQEIIVYAGGV